MDSEGPCVCAGAGAGAGEGARTALSKGNPFAFAGPGRSPVDPVSGPAGPGTTPAVALAGGVV